MSPGDKVDNKGLIRELYKDGLIKVIKSDLSRICEPTISNFLKWYTLPKGTVIRYVVWFRVVQWARINSIRRVLVGPVAYLKMRHYEFKYGVHANANIYVGKGLHIVHGNGVYLNCDYIGDNFTVYQGVTLGTNHELRPTILNNVTVYTNSVVCGGITLHDGCTVGALSYLDKDVESGVLVAGIPAVPVKDEQS